MILELPADGMLVLIGPSGAGKSTFAARHFPPSRVLSSDAMRGVVADDVNDQRATPAAFELLHTALGLRLAAGHLTVVDATNVESWARANLLAIARRHGRPALALVFSLPVEVCLEHNARRPDRRIPPATIRRQHRRTERSLAELDGEGFQRTWRVTSEGELDALSVEIG